MAAGFAATRALRRPDRSATAASIARSMSGSLGGRRGLTAPELQRACFSEVVRHVAVDPAGRTTLPSRFVLGLNPADLDVVEEGRSWFIAGLADALHSAARDHGWRVAGDISIDVEADPSRRPGAPTATVSPDPEGETRARRPAPEVDDGAQSPDERSGTRLVLERSDTGERVSLTGRELTIGRSRDRDISVDDGRVSRSHAHIERRQRGWVIIDEGSSNGTRVDGEEIVPLRPTPIRNGTTLGIGPVDLRVRAVRVRGSEPRARALEDSDRNRISREYLPSSEDAS